ncbi:thioredoxin reductase [Thermosipho melanesiensis]|uniref:Thioredoxin reductase n=2 Tax=Thermosipho melanesiensis TaxID=46541 RepID=A6LKG9_THEM4|nr:thioredoxin-disulfide reductase [Thermosipho melanesiensis]ABR30420.1 thioredoxin reductase [Thermosipho melanesiensis BI429]APT73580.1 thioredoxin reductase [Thermosipho melanesiensis]OOC37528.1 thioredoxin reductase [Thermosipho melanesiensis]OOC39424.1 thioredoxin reductase [Thermosipho melanesiensis]OOC39487.1 thioredoxin reductase [Thermosipho melanesiensis]
MVHFDLGNISTGPKEYYDVLIVGAGPAGLTAAIYAGRAGLSAVVFEKALEGGAVTQTHVVENWPGIIKIEGGELGEKFAEHAKAFGAEIVTTEIMKISYDDEYRYVELDNGKKVKGKVLIYATGAVPRKLGVPGEEEFRGRGVTYCAACDGYLFSGKDVVVVGGGDSACDEAHFLAKMVKSITMVQNLPYLTAAKVLQDRLLQNKNVKVILNSLVKEIRGTDKVEEVVVVDNETGKETVIKAEGVFIYVGLQPNSDLVKEIVEVDEYGYILTDENMETNVPGIYAVGDVRKKNLRQIVTAAADGAIAVEHAAKKYF